MVYLGSWLPTVGTVAMVALVQNVAVAKTAREVNQIAQAITVKVAVGQGNGSGILLQKNGDVYTVLTAAHVVNGKAESQLTITTNDDQQYRVVTGSVRKYQGDVDLAIVKFRSSKNYKLAELGDSNKLEGGMELYVAGFPAPTEVITESVFVFREGKVTANSKRAFKNGYGLLYSNDTLPGMSGGPVLNETGQVVGIHGRGDLERQSRAKTGFNAGIPIARFADIASGLGVETGTSIARTVQSPTLTADDYFVSANQKYEQGSYQGALADYDRAIAINPNYAKAYVNRGFLKYDKLNDLKGALADYDRAIAINPNLAEAYNNRGNLKDDKLNNPQGALADYDRAIALNPNYAYAYNNRGNLKQDKLNNPQGALADYDRAIALNPNLAEAYNNRGSLKGDKLNNPQGALADYDRAITLNPNLADAYYNRGNLKYQKLNNPQGALADYDRAIALNPNLADAYYNRGSLKYQKLNNPQGALADYDRAIAINPNYAEAYSNRGVLKHQKLNNSQGALADYDRAIAINPNYAKAYVNRGKLKQYKLNNPQGALADYDRVITLDPNDANVYVNRGNLKYQKLNDLKGSLADYNRAIAINPNYAEAYNNRGNLKYQKLNNLSGALQDFSYAIKLNPQLEDGYYNRGDLLYTAGRKTEALQDFRKVRNPAPTGLIGLIATGIIAMEERQSTSAITHFNQAMVVDPQTGDAFKYRGLAYRQQGNTAQAIQDWRKAAQLYKDNNSTRDYQVVRGWLKELGVNI
jgi:tetratricopeptide (TPR) repeat protein/V8-like Glu-specific endopeptidase